VAGHGRRLSGAQSLELGKEMVVWRFGWKKARAVGPRGARGRSERVDAVCMADGGSTAAAASGGAKWW
jgi:hypothetical protein